MRRAAVPQRREPVPMLSPWSTAYLEQRARLRLRAARLRRYALGAVVVAALVAALVAAAARTWREVEVLDGPIVPAPMRGPSSCRVFCDELGETFVAFDAEPGRAVCACATSALEYVDPRGAGR